MSETLVQAIQLALESDADPVNTTVPGKIVSYDAARNRAVVIPDLPRKLANGEYIQAPQIVEVPIVFPTSGMNGKQAAITLPVAPGDGVMLSFSQRSMENWLSGTNDIIDDPRQFDLSDCIATPGLNVGGVVGDSENLVVRLDKASVVLKPDNSIVMGNENGSITIDADGNIVLKGASIVIDTPANSFAAENHRHRDVMPGAGNSGIPVP